MTIGGSIFLIVVGAILKFAITDSISGVDLQTIGVILMVAGVLGLILGIWLYTRATRDPRVPVDRRVPPDARY